MNTWRGLLAAISVGGIVATSQAGVGDVDPTFGINGVFQTALVATGDCVARFSASAQAGLLGDGSIVYATASGGGTTQYGHTDANGHPDTAYGPAGSRVLQAGFEMCSGGGRTGPVLRTPDGKLWLGGSMIGTAGRQSAILRLDSSGNPDSSFGSGGMVTRPAGSFEINSKSGDGNWVYQFASQPDGRVLALLAGLSSSTDIAVGIRRYNRDGSADAGFGNGGAAVLPVYSIPYFHVLRDGGLYLGWDYGDIETFLDANGAVVDAPTADASPLPAGYFWRLVATLPGGDSIYAGNDGTRDLIARLHTDGTPSRTFGGSGTGYLPIVGDRSGVPLSMSQASSAAGSADGRHIFVAGLARIGNICCNYVSVVTKLDGATGAPDQNFGDRGIVVLGPPFGVSDLVAQPDGSVVVLSGTRAIRLQGGAAPSPGMVGIMLASAVETAGTMTVRVVRTAGNGGAVSVAYATNDSPAAAGSIYMPATAGKDYTAVAGRLDWADGDTADKLITIPVMNDAAVSSSKVFEIALSAVAGSPVTASPKVTATIVNVAAASVNSAASTSGTNASQPASGGGGAFNGLVLILLLCLLIPRPVRCRSGPVAAFVLAGTLLVPGPLRAGVGDFDASFGSAGFTNNIVGVLPDGRLIYHSGPTAAYDYANPGGSTLFLRTDINGLPDPGYATGALSPLSTGLQYSFSSARTADGRLLLGAGAVLRLDTAGNLDPTFGNVGIGIMDPMASSFGNWIQALAEQPDGRVLALINDTGGGYFHDDSPTVGALIRYNVDGSIDRAFGNGGIAAIPKRNYCDFCYGPITSLYGGVIRVGGWASAAYFSPGGELVTSAPVNSDLVVSAYNLQVAGRLPAGGALLAGSTAPAADASGSTLDVGTNIAMARQRADGSLDRIFGADGSGYAKFDFGQLVLGLQGVNQYLQKVSVTADGKRIYMAVGLSRTLSNLNCSNCSNQVGLVIVRFLIDASGNVALDPVFGSNGLVLLAKWAPFTITDIAEQPGGGVILTTSNGQAFRLLGNPARSPGIIGVNASYEATSARESDGKLLARLSRTAGKDGAISVSYATRDHLPASGISKAYSAAAGTDYVAVSGRLDWADGDSADKIITVPIINDGVVEPNESFDIVLADAAGGPLLDSMQGGTTINATIVNDGNLAGSATATASAGPASTPGAAASAGGGSADAWLLCCLLACLLLRLTTAAPAAARRY